MPTFEDWENALREPRYVYIDSTDNLASIINSKPNSLSFSGLPKVARGVSEFSPPRPIAITVGELLLYLGRITTPRIGNLADLCSTWAKLRYIWAFRPDRGSSRLRLSNEALEIDFHQKGLMSDEIGIGMAALITERYFGGKNPIDVDIALRGHVIPMLHCRYSTTPDYLFEYGENEYIVVECKGTRSGVQMSHKQLKRATEQLPSIVFSSEYQPLSLAIGTNMSSDGTDVFIIDPPEKGDIKNEKKQYFIEDEKKFKEDLQLIRISNLYLFAGDTTHAAAVTPSRKMKNRLKNLTQRENPPERIRIQAMGEEYYGILQEFRINGEVNKISIFNGLSSKVYESLATRNIKAIEDVAKEHYEKSKLIRNDSPLNNLHEDSPGPIFIEKNNYKFRTNIFGRDGTIFRIEVSR